MTKGNLLLVEDDEYLGFIISDLLRENNYAVVLAKTGNEGYEAYLKETFDLCLLDIMLPEKDGITLAKEIRKINEQTPIIFLTAKSMEQDKITGFKAGADDYLVKPFSMPELLLRIEAILKRYKKSESTTENKVFFEIGKYLFDANNFELIYENDKKILTKKEANLLKLLCIHQNNVIDRQTLLKVVWGENDYFLGRSMDVFITRLRKYLAKDASIKIINVHGVGFMLEINR
jgi:DNA-binding response OmpR family regulator